MKKVSLIGWVLIGFVLGAIVGALMGADAAVFKPLGTIFVRLLRMLVFPLIFATLAVGVSGVGGVKLGRMLGKTFLLYYSTAIFAIILGLILANLSGVGIGMDLGKAAEVKIGQVPPLSEVLMNIVPTNPFEAFTKGDALQVIFFAIIFGISMGLAGRAAEPLKNVLQGVAETMYKVVGLVLYVAPIGVFGLIANTVGSFGLGVLKPFAMIIFLVYLGNFLQVVLIYASYLRFIGGIRPFRFFSKIKDAMLFAFTTSSSSATLPVTMQAMKRTGVSEATAGFVLPVGATVNMDGTAIYQAVAAVFLANAYGVELSFANNVTIGVTAILASVGTAGVPGSGMIMLSMVLAAINVPIEGIALIAGIDRILDMARTCVNVVDDTVATALVATTEGERLNDEMYVRPPKAGKHHVGA